ncbi:MAG TPA: TetR/AcrR family transcriptional regulator [Mycobacteriales bacterium]|nr:TetR/AcrR family transcriptional regulator [Mycobacteriales bacterium]
MRPTKQEIDDEIVERAAALFARYGFEQTSVQRIADAVGYSKTGLLHRFPTKEALQDAVIDRWAGKVRAIAAGVSDLPPGPERDLAVITGVVDLALRGPGVVSLLLGALSSFETGETAIRLKTVGAGLFDAFAADKDGDPERAVRIGAALGGLAVISLATRDAAPPGIRTHLIAAGYDALGHHRPGAQ